jgi:hypothetical protein
MSHSPGIEEKYEGRSCVRARIRDYRVAWAAGRAGIAGGCDGLDLVGPDFSGGGADKDGASLSGNFCAADRRRSRGQSYSAEQGALSLGFGTCCPTL